LWRHSARGFFIAGKLVLGGIGCFHGSQPLGGSASSGSFSPFKRYTPEFDNPAFYSFRIVERMRDFAY
jgi:hypothetical protein